MFIKNKTTNSCGDVNSRRCTRVGSVETHIRLLHYRTPLNTPCGTCAHKTLSYTYSAAILKVDKDKIGYRM